MDPQEMVARIGGLFELVSPDYDNVGVDFFGPIAEALIDGLQPAPGARVAEFGCGAGALTTRLASRVGRHGHVRGVDLSAGMLDRARKALAAGGLGNVTLAVGNAAEPDLPTGSFDVVAASLVIFFLPDPAAALARWVELLKPGGVVGVTTFGDGHEAWEAAEAELDPWFPSSRRGEEGESNPFESTDAMHRMMLAAGTATAASVRRRIPVQFESIDQFVRWSQSVGHRIAWDSMPADRRPGVISAMREDLAPATDHDGRIHVWQDILVTTGRRAG
jgi:ubiquinone/menaquinone biosynthesis C-methylase UbiE